MAASPNQLSRLHQLLQSDEFKTKKPAFMQLIAEDPTVLDGFGSVHSAEMNVLTQYRNRYHAQYLVRGPRGHYRQPAEDGDAEHLSRTMYARPAHC